MGRLLRVPEATGSRCGCVYGQICGESLLTAQQKRKSLYSRLLQADLQQCTSAGNQADSAKGLLPTVQHPTGKCHGNSRCLRAKAQTSMNAGPCRCRTDVRHISPSSSEIIATNSMESAAWISLEWTKWKNQNTANGLMT